MASTSTSGQLPDHLDVEPLSNRTLLVPSRLDNDDITINLDDLFSPDDSETQIVVDLFKDERAPVVFWVRLIQEAWRIKRYTLALEMLEQGIAHLDPKGKCTLLCVKANYLLALARKAPKTVLSEPRGGPPLTHSTDPNHPESKLRDPHAPPNTKDALWQAAEVCIGRAEGTHVNDKTITDLKGPLSSFQASSLTPQHHAYLLARYPTAVLMLARGRLDEASRLFESILATEPTHLYALMARARILFARRSFRLALKAYQQVLTLAPKFFPDPRIGIGLCCWLMGDRKKAKAAWNRSIVVHPDSSSNSATLLLGLAHLNTSKDPTLAGGEEARTEEYSRGIELIQVAFKKDNASAAALGALANFFLLSGRPGTIKLAERMIQFADARILASEGYLHLARSLHSTGDRSAALSVYQQSSEMFPDQLLALLSEAQFLIESNSWPAAVNLYENVLRRNPRCAEALCALASIHAQLAFSDSSVVDSQAERKKAKDAYDQILRLFASGKEAVESVQDHVVNKYIAKSERVRELARDEQMFVEIAKVWDDEMQSGERCLRAYREAQRILDEKNENEEDAELAGTKEERALLATRLANNIGVLEYHRQDPIAAQESIESALVKIGEKIASNGGKISEQDDAALSVCTYNRGVILEALGDDELAINECYNQLLSQHPEYIEAKARLALIALRGVTGPQRQKNFELANQYLKEMLTTNSAALEVRALQSYYLYTAGLYRNLKDFARATLELDAKDAYALTTRGIIAFHEARENRDPSREGSKMRQQLFVRSAQYFERALQQHKDCAIAAQGIAILIAENVLGSGIETSTMTGEVNTAMVALNKDTRDALTILNKVKESVNDASVYVNIGHCHFHREEFERAIESVSFAPVFGCFPALGQALNCERGTSQYETASKRYHKDQEVTILQYVARAWYHKGVKDQSFNDIRQALEKGRLALSLQPRDLSIKYNIALMQQKGVQVLFDLTPQRRTLEQLRLAIQDANESQALFLELQNDPADPAPYQKGFPRQRFNYGKGLLTRAPLIQEAQETYEATEQAAVDRARQAREEERRRRDEMEAQRLAQLQGQASRLAEQRKRMQEEAAQWTLSATFADSDEDGFEVEKKERKKREKKSVGGGKKRGKKEKREGSETAESSSEGDEDKPKKKRVKCKSKKDRRKSETPRAEMDLDEDGEEAVTGGNRRKKIGRASKNIKSNEFIESSDEE